MDACHGAHVARPKHEAQQEGQEDVEGKQVLDTVDDWAYPIWTIHFMTFVVYLFIYFQQGFFLDI